ncbi:MAG: DMT family transporter, partial [Victivallales bacterium]|nr:DMT family transporter [Victivallales bacterium]
MKLKNTFFLLLTAIIWGFAFTAQKSGMAHVGPYTFNCIRSLLGALFLIPCIFLLDKFKLSKEKNSSFPLLLTGGIICGIALAVASSLQQIGICYTEAGKAGFITACYIIIVPIIGIFLRKPWSWLLWIAVLLAVVALYLLCMNPNSNSFDINELRQFTLSQGDRYVLLCAFVFAVHILVVDFFAPKMDCIKLSCIQFFTVAVLCGFMMFKNEGCPSWSALKSCYIPILYAGIMSSGIAYTLQILGQKNYNPTIASIIMSLESTFAVIGSWLLLDERLSRRQLYGCAIMFVAIILAQIPSKKLM